MATVVKPRDKKPPPDQSGSNNRGLTPSDQLLGICLVNVILACWVGIAFAAWYDPYPDLPKWMYAAEGLIFVISFGLSTFDSWGQTIKSFLANPDEKAQVTSVSVPILVLKVAVFALTITYLFVLWMLAEKTGGVISPFAPFITAPALFAPFVTKNGSTIFGLSVLVTIAIGLSHKTGTLHLDILWPYKGSAAVMVLLAGTLTALRMRVSKRGPLTGEGSDQGPASPHTPSPAT